ncbi:MAG: hypothetical protein L3K14_05190 [Thermoplasmata archaeon]|nr:hypothetical protein [Thermoplasmata archaeon]
MDALPSLILISIGVLGLLAATLGVVEWRRFRVQGARSHLYWAVGLVLVFFTLFEEALFYAGIWTSALLSSYFFLVALLVGILSLGSAESGLPPNWRRVYTAYIALTTVVVGFFCATSPVGGGVLSQGIVTGNPSLGVILSSTALTVPAATLMAGLALLGVYRRRVWRLGYIAAGILVISAAGGLYIVSIPVTLYYAEFIGVFLLYVGFGGVRPSSLRQPASALAAGGN